ncbi:MAG: methyltransferase domain-containing protein [Rhodobacteraceae bacterium]|nr:methyltransferase domain-containing protein [Paracoccaceae bacterium]
MPGVLPPTYDRTVTHGMSPNVGHDDIARFNLLTNLNVHLGQSIFPGTKLAFENRVEPEFKRANGRAFDDQREMRAAMRADPLYQMWAALRRTTMEMRQQSGRQIVFRQREQLSAKAQSFNDGANTLQLDPSVEIPDYLSSVDNHWMPGSYYTETAPGDVAAGACYEIGLFVTTAGSMSARGDGGGRTLVSFLREQHPEFQPRRILDLGGGMGVNSVPLAQAYPDAEVIVADVAAPSLRFGHARARALGIGNIRFVQMGIDDLRFEPESFDWIQSTMVWHETSAATLIDGMKQIYGLLKPGGLTLHIEQPNFTDKTTLWEKFTRDWDSWYNNEPFWAKLHTMDVFQVMADAGFARDKMFDEGVEADIEQGLYQSWASTLSRHKPELKRAGAAQNDGARKGERWYLFGAWK